MMGELFMPFASRVAGLTTLVAASLTLGSAPQLQPAAAHRAGALATLNPEMESQIATMSTGDEQALAVSGDIAQERNRAIPLMSGRTELLARFAAVPASSDQYDTAVRCLAQVVYYEAALEPELGQRAVAQVVLNRVRHPAYPNSVCGVVYQGSNQRVCQFSFTCDGSLLRAPMKRYWDRAIAIARETLAGKQVPEVGTATHYHADYVVPRWAFTLGKIRQVGHHIFYRFPGNPGRSAAFYDSWAGIERIPSIDYGRLQAKLDAQVGDVAADDSSYVPGLTVTPHVTDRHAVADVGGRLDTTTAWRLTIPDPVELSAGYRATRAVQGDLMAPAVPQPVSVNAGESVE